MVRCVIPARKGSKRIYGKNLLKIGGKTLIDISVESAVKSQVCDQVILSTDINMQNENKNVILDKRKRSTAGDRSSSTDFMKYIIEKYKCSENDVIIFLQPTSPGRSFSDVRRAFEIFGIKKKPVVSVFKSKKLHDNLCIKGKNSLMNKITLRKQEIFQINGAIFIFTVSQFNEAKGIPQTMFAPYIMEEKDSVDIDEYTDYIKAALLH